MSQPSPSPSVEPEPTAELQEAESIGSATQALIPSETPTEATASLVEDVEEMLEEQPGEAPPSEEFFVEPEIEVPYQGRQRPPEMRAAPADLRSMAPKSMRPPSASVSPEPPASPPPAEAAVGAEPAEESEQVPPWQPTVGDYEQESPESAWPEAQAGDQAFEDPYAQPYEQPYAEPEPEPVRVPAPVRPPMPMQVRPAGATPHTPRPLTSSHPIRPATHAVPLQGKPRSATSLQTSHGRLATGPQAHAGHGRQTASVPLPPAPQIQPHAHPVHPPQRLLPSGTLILIGVMIGLIVGVVCVARTPIAGKLGLLEKSISDKFALAVVSKERSEVQLMLNVVYNSQGINLAQEMKEFRSERGLKRPEEMTLEEFLKYAPESAAPATAETDKEKPKEEDKSKAPK